MYVLFMLQDSEKRTPMHATSYYGETECVAVLIQAGKTIHLTTPFPYVDKSTGHNVCNICRCLSTCMYCDFSMHERYLIVHMHVYVHILCSKVTK